MLDPAGLFLIALVVWASAELWPVPAIRRGVFGPTLTFRGDLLLLGSAAAWMILQGPVRFDGSAWLIFDSRASIRLTAEMTTWGLWGLFLIAFARRTGRNVEWEYPTPADQAEVAVRLGMTVLLVSDDWGLFLFGWILTVVPQPRQCPANVHVDAFQASAESMWNGLRWISVPFAAMALGFLAWELSIFNWTDLAGWLSTHPEPTGSQSALLFLSGFFGIIACLLLTAQFPFHSLAIESGNSSALWNRPVCLLSVMLPAWTLLWKLQPVFDQVPTVTSLGRSLAFLTFLLGGVASLKQKDAPRTVRTIAIAHTGVVFIGLLQNNPELRTAAVGHALLLVVWLFCWGQVPVWNTLPAAQHNRVRAGVTMWGATILLHSGVVGSLRLLAHGDYPGNGALSFAAWFALTFAAFRFLLSETRAVPAAAGEPNRFRPRLSTWFPLALAVPLYFEPEHLFPVYHPREPFTPLSWELMWTGWEFPAATMLAFATALVWERSLRGELVLPPHLTSVAQGCETHFSLTNMWLLILRLPLQLAGAGIGLVERGVFVAAQDSRNSREQMEADVEPATMKSFITWELLRGVLCVVVLCLVFLWGLT